MRLAWGGGGTTHTHTHARTVAHPSPPPPPTQPLLAVGIEGAWGVLLCTGALPLLSQFHTPEGVPVDSAGDAMRAVIEYPQLRYAVGDGC